VPPLLQQQISADDVFGLIPFWERGACRAQVASARNEGLYTPPSTQGTVVFPMTGGGVNWGGAAFDPVNQILYANTSRAITSSSCFRALPWPMGSTRRPDTISDGSRARRSR
jgi:quinoprotein glucose dehydrogenase